AEAPEPSPTLCHNTLRATFSRWPRSPAGRPPAASIGAAVARKAHNLFSAERLLPKLWALVLERPMAGFGIPPTIPMSRLEQESAAQLRRVLCRPEDSTSSWVIALKR